MTEDDYTFALLIMVIFGLVLLRLWDAKAVSKLKDRINEKTDALDRMERELEVADAERTYLYRLKRKLILELAQYQGEMVMAAEALQNIETPPPEKGGRFDGVG